MKKAVYWLMGERGGKATLAVWNWLWGISEEAPGPDSHADLDDDAIATAEAAIEQMQKSVIQLAEATNQQYATFQREKKIYLYKVGALKRAEESALNAEKEGRHDDAEAAIASAIHLEQLLPKVEAQVEQAETLVNTSLAKLRQERARLERYKSDLQALKNLTEVNEALTAIAETHNEQDMASARAQFEAAKNSVHTRYLEKRAFVELSVNPTEQAMADIDPVAQQQEIQKRLQQLKQRQQTPRENT
ncbi:PspA/IM30 family protein [Leptolyngbyaceae cyanobacterium CCMR0082]|uniref:PspA/IM30 family protein n=1 Tax=Adonisia turfae CCMR0082 TaxID=2304604 RepID=A0A6M0S231_9CYAN|nr:PspA/IM30 family protein [Adonisia turfae]NEZ62310.1 PspA/IM30 family protein [Adonisia turfae CCMR0082]